MEEQEQYEYKLVATKVSIAIWRRFVRVMRRVGMSGYNAIQNFIDVVIRYGDDRHNLSPEMEKLMASFEQCQGWDKQFNLADPTTEPEITEATYYLRDKTEKGVRVVHIERPFFGQWTQTYNVKQILEKFLCLTFPQLYRRLRFIAVCKECDSILELLFEVVAELERDEEKCELRKPFEDAERSEWGHEPKMQQYKIHHRRTPDGEAMREERQRTFNFDEDGEAKAATEEEK